MENMLLLLVPTASADLNIVKYVVDVWKSTPYYSVKRVGSAGTCGYESAKAFYLYGTLASQNLLPT